MRTAQNMGRFNLPVERWVEAGIRVDIGTDHPVALATDLVKERQRMRQAFPMWAAEADTATPATDHR